MGSALVGLNSSEVVTGENCLEGEDAIIYSCLRTAIVENAACGFTCKIFTIMSSNSVQLAEMLY